MMALQNRIALFLDASKDLEIDTTDGSLVEDSTVQTRALMRLLTKRGKYWADKNFGSRWWTINSIDDARRQVLPMAREALQPLLDTGEIEKVELIALQTTANGIKAHLALHVPYEELIEIRNLPIGRLG
jgi:phage gp46-like protein